jgi:predicted dehydrogenase
LVGVQGYGSAHADAYLARPDCAITHIVDVDAQAAQRMQARVSAAGRSPPRVVRDMRAAFDDREVDLVSFATPNHWHALGAVWAMQAGKDVYLEKPVTHAIAEGAALVDAARSSGRICQAGTQHRSDGLFLEACELLKKGGLGEVKLARCLSYRKERSLGPRGSYAIPEGVDFDLWCGPAEPRPISRRRFHSDWQSFWDFGEGCMGRAMAHWLDLARGALRIDEHPSRVFSYGGRFLDDAGETPNAQVAVFAYPSACIVAEIRALGSSAHENTREGVIFEGSDGYLVLTPTRAAVFDRRGRTRGVLRGPALSHFDNFIDAVRGRRSEILRADIAQGCRSSAMIHFANAAYRAGRALGLEEIARELTSTPVADDVRDTLERMRAHLEEAGVDLKPGLASSGWLEVDGRREAFADRAEANRFLAAHHRPPFSLPSPAAPGR